MINVANFSFSGTPSEVSVGDVIEWDWVSGGHNTNSLSVPPGASTWFNLIDDEHTTFQYTVVVPGTYTFNCSFHPGAMTGSFTASAVLPVKLSEFKLVNENNNAILKWTTESEDNIDYFSVQKSKTSSDFVEVGRVKAAGHSSEAKTYTYTDANASSADEYYYYTIAIVDKEGKKEFSSVQLFKNKVNVSKLILALSPNPVSRSGHLMLKFNADKTSKMNVKVTDFSGKTVMETTLQAYEGVNNGHLMLGDVAAGSYSVSFELNGIREVHKLIIR